MRGCAYCSYLWGHNLKVVVDQMALGQSLREHGNKASMVLCINEDTLELPMAQLLNAWWDLYPVKHVELPPHLRGTEQRRLQGVYSKLQTVKLFDMRPMKQRRVVMMDGDMIVRSNIDDLFSINTPAGVMRGEADSCLFEQRPYDTFFQRPSSWSSRGSTPKMTGGINGGLVLFEPSIREYNEMMEELRNFMPTNRMAEQEFLSMWWAGKFFAIHKKYNFQLHQLYFATPEPPPGQDRTSSYCHMAENPDEIKILHFSADRKPSEVLIDFMPSVEGWLNLEDHLNDLCEHMMQEHGARNPRLASYTQWIKQIELCLKRAYREWFEVWKRAYFSMISFVLDKGIEKIFRQKHGDETCCYCTACGKEWDVATIQANTNILRDHILFNCETMASQVKIEVKHMMNFMVFFHVPCGAEVESKLTYLGALYSYYEGLRWEGEPDDVTIALDAETPPSLTLPAYSIPASIVAVTQDVNVDAAFAEPTAASDKLKQMMRRYGRAMETIGKHNAMEFKHNAQVRKYWLQTVTTAHESLQWIMNHGPSIEEKEGAKALKSKASSATSSSAGSAAPSIQAVQQSPFPSSFEPPPPWKRQRGGDAAQSRAAIPKAMPIALLSRPPTPPPPPPPPAR